MKAASDKEVQILFKNHMGPTVFTVTEPALDGSVSIVPDATLSFSKEGVMKMLTSSGITVKETGKENPKSTTCRFLTAGPITGMPQCDITFGLISMDCSCQNFPRSDVLALV